MRHYRSMGVLMLSQLGTYGTAFTSYAVLEYLKHSQFLYTDKAEILLGANFGVATMSSLVYLHKLLFDRKRKNTQKSIDQALQQFAALRNPLVEGHKMGPVTKLGYWTEWFLTEQYYALLDFYALREEIRQKFLGRHTKQSDQDVKNQD